MASRIKAIVFKTKQLQATRNFFNSIPGLRISEASAQHFVVHSKGIRLVFLESANGFEIELYVQDGAGKDTKEIKPDLSSADFSSYKDPNGITIVIAGKNRKAN